ncbi:hypothetical protein BE04_30345 [Sorangium cellulosum]|uniref:Uncharacterized protein n=1 Tax=Sorangium cellulosum TaxID=56 RepID=A0A150P6U6_SORCE|nr:hypothetical protein BE04_30345 [Sorangium cellulosum]
MEEIAMDSSGDGKPFPIVEPDYTGWSDEERLYYIKWQMAVTQRILRESRSQQPLAQYSDIQSGSD